MTFTRRQAILTTLFGSGLVGLRAMATGLPASLLLDPRRALADPNCASQAKAQFFILSTSAGGDPINANAPGCYGSVNSPLSMVAHPSWKALQAGGQLKGTYDFTADTVNLRLGGQSYTAGAPWGLLAPATVARTTFWHIMTNTPVHPKEPEVLSLMGAAPSGEMLPSMLAKAMGPCLGTIQMQPISVGAGNPSETLSFTGRPLPNIPPTALRTTLTSPTTGPLAPLTNLQQLRDQTMNDMYAFYREQASPAQQSMIDQLVLSQQQVRNLNQNLLAALDSIADNSLASQITAAVTLIQMKVTPVVSLHIPFGGDNHTDTDLKNEAQQTADGVTAIQSLMDALTAAGLQDAVSFMTLNVFGRTLGPANGPVATDGRQHNGNHQVSVTIGKAFKPGVIGSLVPVGKDFGASAIQSSSGAGNASGDIKATDTLAAFGMTMLAAVGADPSAISSPMLTAKVIPAALA